MDLLSHVSCTLWDQTRSTTILAITILAITILMNSLGGRGTRF